MNAQIREIWAKALTSGRYTQGHNQLKTHDNVMCCMGVLCDLHAKETGNQWDGVFYLSNVAGPPQPVKDWAGISSANVNTLMEFNDVTRLPFEVIAEKLQTL